MTHAPDETRLLPCPWCGSAPEIIRSATTGCYLQCQKPTCPTKTPWYRKESNAIAAWNRRTPTPPPDDRAEVAKALRACIDNYEADPVNNKDRPSSWGKLDAMIEAAKDALHHLDTLAPQASEGGEVERLREAVIWVLRDASYKAPEAIDHVVTDRWIERLRAALPHPEPTEK